MKNLALILVLLTLSTLSHAQQTIATTSRWTDLGEDKTGVHMYVSFNMLGREITLDSEDSTLVEGDITTRCRYRLSNFSDKEVVVSRIYITLYCDGEEYDTYVKRENIRLKPWENHYGAFLTPKLREAKKMVERANMSIRARETG
jgi:hypothetical protein